MTTNNAVNTYIVPTTANEVTMPAQPCFFAYNSVNDANQTGNGATPTVEFDTEVFDQNADYNTTTDTFTAPVSGRYFFSACIHYRNVTVAAGLLNLRFVTSNLLFSIQHGENIATGTFQSMTGSTICDMDAADTTHIVALVTGEVADTVGITGAATAFTYFSGGLFV